jgi:regulator of RNase E activity RraA
VSNLMPIDEATREQLRAASTATITTQLFRLGLRNQFLNGLLPANGEHCRFVGEAATLRYIPMREDLDVVEAYRDPDHPQRKAIETARAGTVLVMDCRGETRAASVGNILATVIAQPAAEQEELERYLLERVEAGAPLPGTYPPNEYTLVEFGIWKKQRG